jgi:hypothetical protein
MPCSPLKVNRRFGGTYRLHLQGRTISQARIQSEAKASIAYSSLRDSAAWSGVFGCHLLSRWYLARFMLFRNAGWLSTDYTALYPRRQYPSYVELFMCFITFVQYWQPASCGFSFTDCEQENISQRRWSLWKLGLRFSRRSLWRRRVAR